MVYDRGSKSGKGHKHNRHLARFRQIAVVAFKYQLGDFIKTLGMEKFLRMRFMPPNPWRKTTFSKPERTRMALEELGTTFVKVGQILSTRTDLLPVEFTQELAKLQNSMQPLPAEIIEESIQKELGRPISEIFATFDHKPIGVASIGQAHSATLLDGTEVIVKARKPGVFEQVSEDLDILRQMAASASERWEDSLHYDLNGIIEEIAEALTAEMDYVQEGHNAEYFARFFHDDSKVHIPKIFWEYTTSRVITLERIRGIGILDIPSITAAGLDKKDLAKRAVSLWLRMVFEGVQFHADPHPGNLFVEPNGRLGLIDFGMVGMVDDEVRENLANAVRAILERDVDLLIDSLVELGAVRRDGSREGLRADLKHIMGHYPKSSGLDLQGSSHFGELFIAVQRNHVQLPSNTFMLLKTMAMAQSLGKGLYPDFDIFNLLEPSIKKAVKQTRSPMALFRQLPSAVADLANFGIGLPRRLNRIVRALEKGELQVKTDVSGVEKHLEHLERLVNRLVFGLVISAGFLGITILILAYILNLQR
jgi:ubiquinone biosynthesis protein